MPEKACQNPLTSPVWPQKGSCPPGDSSLFLCLGVGRGAIFPNRKNGWRKTRRAGGSAMCRGLPVGAWLCGRQGSCLGRGTGRRGARGIAGKGGGIAPGNYFEERGAGWQGAAGQGRFREGASGGIVPENCFEEGARGGRARWGKGGSKKGRAVASSRRIASRKGAGGGRARRETTRRKNAGQKEKGGRGPPYLWYLEFCKIWKPR